MSAKLERPDEEIASRSTDARSYLSREFPWPGLLSFREEDHDFFGGRDEEVQELFRRVQSEPLTLLFSAAGLGKTSLLRAGLFPRLRREHFFPVYIRLQYGIGEMTLPGQVRAAIVDQAAQWNVEASHPTERETLWEYFHRRDTEFWDARNFVCVPVLVFDQFEEVFTKGRPYGEQVTALFEELADLIDGHWPRHVAAAVERDKDAIRPFDPWVHRYRVVFGMREDRLAELEQVSHRFRSIFTNRFRLQRMKGQRALESALKAGGHLMTPAVARRIVGFVGGLKDAAPPDDESLRKLEVEPALLSVFCSELNQARVHQGQTQITAETLTGNKDDILKRFYERAFGAVAPATRAFLEDALVSNDGATRDFVSVQRALAQPGVSAADLETLEGWKIIRIDDLGSVRKIELTHDLLIPLAARSRSDREKQEEVAREKAARLAAERKARRSFGFAFFVAALLALALFALWKWKALEKITARAEARSAFRLAMQSFDNERPGDGLAYLARSLRKDPKDPALGPLVYGQMTGRPWPIVLRSIDTQPNVRTARVSADGRIVAVVTEQGLAVFDVATGHRRGKTIPWRDRSSLLEISNTGRALIRMASARVTAIDTVTGADLGVSFTGGDMAADGSIAFASRGVIRLSAGGDDPRVSSEIPTAPAIATTARISDDGRFVMAVARAGGFAYRARVWDRQATRFVGSWIPPASTPPADLPSRFYFAPDGRYVVAVGQKGTVTTYDATGELLVPPITHAYERPRVFIGPDGAHLLTYSPNDDARLWEIPSGELVLNLPRRGDVTLVQAVFSADGLRLATWTSDAEIRCWSAATGELLAAPISGKEPVRALAFVDGDRNLLTVTDAVRVVRFQGAEAEPLLRRATNSSVATDPSRRLMAVVDRAGRIVVVDDAGEIRLQVPVPEPAPLAIGPDGAWVLSRSADGESRVRVIRRDGKLLVDRPSSEAPQVTADGRYLLIPAADKTGYRRIDVATGAEDPLPARGRIFTSPKGRYLASNDSDEGSRLWEKAKDGRWRSPIRLSSDKATFFQFSPDENVLLVGLSGRSVEVRSLPSNKLIASIRIDAEAAAAEFSPDGALLAVVLADGVRLFDTRPWRRVGEISAVKADHVQFSADGTRLMLADGVSQKAEVWDIHDPSEPRPIAVNLRVDMFTWPLLSADGQRVLAVRDGDLVRIDIPSFASADAPLLADLAEALGRAQATEIGRAQTVDSTRENFRAIAQRCYSKERMVCRLAAWLAYDGPDPKLSPSSNRSVAEYVRERAPESAESWLRLAALFPGHPALGPKPPEPPPPAAEALAP